MDYLKELWDLYENDLTQRMGAAVDRAQQGKTDLGGGTVKYGQIQRKPQPKPVLRDPVDSTPAKIQTPINPDINLRNQQTKEINVARQQGVKPGEAYERIKGQVNTGDPNSVGDFAATLSMTQMDRSQAPKIEPGSQSVLAKDVDQNQNETLPDDGDLKRPSGMEISDEDEQENLEAGERDKIVTSDRGEEGTEDKLDKLREPGEDISAEEDPDAAEMELDAEIEDLDQILDGQWEEISNDINTRIDEMSKISELKARRLREKFDTFSKAFNKIPSTQNRSSFLSAIGKAKTYQGRINSGAGKNNLGYLDVQSLKDNKERLMKGYGDGSPEVIEKFVRSVRSTKVDPEFIDSSFEMLPEKFKSSLSGKGKVGQKDVHFLGYDKDGNPKRGQASSKDRAKLMWQYYLEQGGRDAYTGLPLDLESMDLEHVMAFDNKDNGKPSREDYENREHEKNHVLTNSNINQKKSSMNMKDFLEKEMDPFLDMSEEDFAGRQAMFDRANKIGDESQQLIQTLVDEISEDGKLTGKELSSGMTIDLLRGHFDTVDKSYEDLRKEFRKNAKTKEDKSKADGLKSGLGKELLMSLGMTRGLPDKSGRRTNKMNENVYRAFLLTMAKADPKQRQNLRQIWEQSIEAGRSERSEKAFRHKIMELGGIDPDIISDKKLGRVFREEWEWGDLVDLTEDTNYNDDVDFLRKYGRA
jgi:hypothetical protein